MSISPKYITFLASKEFSADSSINFSSGSTKTSIFSASSTPGRELMKIQSKKLRLGGGQIKGSMKRLRMTVMGKLGHICLENLYNCRLQN